MKNTKKYDSILSHLIEFMKGVLLFRSLSKSVALSFFVLVLLTAPGSHARVTLQSHQKAPVEYLVQHPEQKGLLLFHSLGSGKTYIALEYAEKFPAKKVLVVLPESLKSSWLTQIASYGVKNPARYEMVSIQQSAQLLTRDLKNTIVVIDEVHKLIQRIITASPASSEKAIEVYSKLQTADKLLLLTGTPIFTDTSDIAYVANLLDTSDTYPVDPVKFRTQFMKVKPVTSLVRGHVTESKLMMLGFPFVVSLAAVVTLGTALPWAIPLVALTGSAVIPVVNEVLPVSQVSFREFDTDKWKDFAKKFVSYYRVQFSADENYPSKEITEKKVEYSFQQANFFLSFVDEDLNTSQLRTLLSEESETFSDTYLKFNSSKLQKQLLATTTSGLEIGNPEIPGPNKKVVESPKFLEVLKAVQEQPGQVAVYSNYFVNGIQRLAAFFDRNGLKGQYQILSPQQSVAVQKEIVDKYNKAEVRILLIHPEITEGISLMGTEQFHILEPINNSALLEQVIGRAVRFRSHAHLPLERRLVRVYLWEATIDYSKALIPTKTGLLRREHWQRKYSEVNPSVWTKGIVDIDSNYFLKDETPDARVKRHKSEVQRDLESFHTLLEQYNVEKN